MRKELKARARLQSERGRVNEFMFFQTVGAGHEILFFFQPFLGVRVCVCVCVWVCACM